MSKISINNIDMDIFLKYFTDEYIDKINLTPKKVPGTAKWFKYEYYIRNDLEEVIKTYYYNTLLEINNTISLENLNKLFCIIKDEEKITNFNQITKLTDKIEKNIFINSAVLLGLDNLNLYVSHPYVFIDINNNIFYNIDYIDDKLYFNDNLYIEYFNLEPNYSNSNYYTIYAESNTVIKEGNIIGYLLTNNEILNYTLNPDGTLVYVDNNGNEVNINPNSKSQFMTHRDYIRNDLFKFKDKLFYLNGGSSGVVNLIKEKDNYTLNYLEKYNVDEYFKTRKRTSSDNELNYIDLIYKDLIGEEGVLNSEYTNSKTYYNISEFANFKDFPVNNVAVFYEYERRNSVMMINKVSKLEALGSNELIKNKNCLINAFEYKAYLFGEPFLISYNDTTNTYNLINSQEQKMANLLNYNGNSYTAYSNIMLAGVDKINLAGKLLNIEYITILKSDKTHILNALKSSKDSFANDLLDITNALDAFSNDSGLSNAYDFVSERTEPVFNIVSDTVSNTIDTITGSSAVNYLETKSNQLLNFIDKKTDSIQKLISTNIDSLVQSAISKYEEFAEGSEETSILVKVSYNDKSDYYDYLTYGTINLEFDVSPDNLNEYYGRINSNNGLQQLYFDNVEQKSAPQFLNRPDSDFTIVSEGDPHYDPTLIKFRYDTRSNIYIFDTDTVVEYYKIISYPELQPINVDEGIIVELEGNSMKGNPMIEIKSAFDNRKLYKENKFYDQRGDLLTTDSEFTKNRDLLIETFQEFMGSNDLFYNFNDNLLNAFDKKQFLANSLQMFFRNEKDNQVLADSFIDSINNSNKIILKNEVENISYEKYKYVDDYILTDEENKIIDSDINNLNYLSRIRNYNQFPTINKQISYSKEIKKYDKVYKDNIKNEFTNQAETQEDEIYKYKRNNLIDFKEDMTYLLKEYFYKAKPEEDKFLKSYVKYMYPKVKKVEGNKIITEELSEDYSIYQFNEDMLDDDFDNLLDEMIDKALTNKWRFL